MVGNTKKFHKKQVRDFIKKLCKIWSKIFFKNSPQENILVKIGEIRHKILFQQTWNSPNLPLYPIKNFANQNKEIKTRQD